jgi:hypothetical protein
MYSFPPCERPGKVIGCNCHRCVAYRRAILKAKRLFWTLLAILLFLILFFYSTRPN